MKSITRETLERRYLTDAEFHARVYKLVEGLKAEIAFSPLTEAEYNATTVAVAYTLMKEEQE